MNRQSPGDEEVRACPSCDEAQLERRSPSWNRTVGRPDERWRCNSCGLLTDEPVIRERRSHPGSDSRSGLAAKLLDADPEEAGR